MNIRGLTWGASKLVTRFGGGYYAEAIVGPAAGLHKFRIAANYLPDAVRTLPEYNSSAWFPYLYNFFISHTTGGETPFIISWNSKYWTVMFSQTDLDAEQFAKGFYSTGIEIEQIKIPSYTSYNADGSST